MLLQVFVDPELAVVLLPVVAVRPLDVRLALEDHHEGSDADLKKTIRQKVANLGRGGGLVVSILALCSDDPSLNPVDYLFLIFCAVL